MTIIKAFSCCHTVGDLRAMASADFAIDFFLSHKFLTHCNTAATSADRKKKVISGSDKLPLQCSVMEEEKPARCIGWQTSPSVLDGCQLMDVYVFASGIAN